MVRADSSAGPSWTLLALRSNSAALDLHPAAVEFHHQHIAGIDLVVAGGFWRAGVPDAAAGALVRCGVAVAERDVVDSQGLV